MNKESEDISFTMLGNQDFGKGKVVYFNVDEYNINGTYLIKTVNHNINNQKHEVKIVIEKRNI